MFPLPSFLSFPWALPSLPSISLPANIQRRFLSYVLKRSLGRFVKAGGLDVERIQAQIGEGRVEIEGLELDTAEINALLPPSIPLTVTSGSLGQVCARIPFPNLWSAPLSFVLDTLTLEFALSPPLASPKEVRPKAARSFPQSPQDLASSVTTAADEFLEELDAYEEAELDRSIRDSVILSQNDPFAADDVPGAFPAGGDHVESATMLAGLVERILARLEFRVKKVVIRVRHDDTAYGAIIELRIDEVRYADESRGEALTTVRSVTVSGVTAFMLPMPANASVVVSSVTLSQASRSSSSSSASSGSSGDVDNEMMMSMAVADLRQSMAASTISGASIYQSAYSEAPAMSPVAEEREEPVLSPARERGRSRTPTSRGPDEGGAPSTMIFSLGQEDIVLRMTTTRSSSTDAVAASSDGTSPVGDVVSAKAPAVSIDLSIGTITAVLLPQHVATLLSAVQSVSRPASEAHSAVPDEPPRTPHPKFEASIHVKALHAAVVYDLAIGTNPAYQPALAQFWLKPSSTDIPVGHIRFRHDTLRAFYIVEAYSPSLAAPSFRNLGNHPRPSSNRRKASFHALSPPSVTVSLVDASIFEYLASAPPEDKDSPPGGSFPVFIFDSNLDKQYEQAPPRSDRAQSPASFPEFDTVDWRNSGLQRRGPGGEKMWKVRQKGRGVLKGGANAPIENNSPVLAIKKDISPSAAAVVDLQPIHLYFDLSLVERLLPLLKHISPAMKRSESSSPTNSPVTPSRRPTFQSLRSESYVLDDLDAQARAQTRKTSASNYAAKIRCPMIRLSIRCPAPVNRRGTWGDGAHLRSGIVDLDLHGIKVKIGRSDTVVKASKKNEAPGPASSVVWKKMILFFSRVPEKKSSAFLVIGPLAPDPNDIDTTVLLPCLEIKTPLPSARSGAAAVTHVTCRIPSVQANIQQSTIEGLQFFADDLTHWLDGAFGDGSRPKPRDELKMIGSRFFGSKASSSASSSMIAIEDDEIARSTVMRIVVSETDVRLFVPRTQQQDAIGDARILSLRASDSEVKLESNVSGRAETAITLSILTAEFADRSDISKPVIILSRTTPLSLTTHTHPIVHLRFSSLTDRDTDTKETDIKAVLSSFTAHVTADHQWLTDLMRFVKTPEGVFEDVVPSEITRLNVQIYDGSLHVKAPTLPGALVLIIAQVEAKAKLEGGEDQEFEVSLGKGYLAAIDDLSAVGDLDARHSSAIEVWKHAGYAQLVDFSDIEVQYTKDNDTQQTLLDVISCRVAVTACADSLATVGQLAGDLGNLVPKNVPTTNVVKSPADLEKSINVFDSIDEDAFNRIPEIISGADLIEDDLPTNLDYLDETAGPSRKVRRDRSTGETLRTWQSLDRNSRVVSEQDGSVKPLSAARFKNQGTNKALGYWDILSPVSSWGHGDQTQIGQLRLRMHDCSVSINLYDGYDWQKTRKAIEDEIKSVRRRLERIRQLLASGQTPDPSVDAPRSVLFNSVYIGWDQSRDNLDSAALLAAIDEELEDLGQQDGSSISSWQTDFPPGHVPRKQSKPKTRLRGKRLTRSKKSQIEISLGDLRTEVDIYDSNAPTASRVQVMIKSMEILDHIKTSTWKKFLGEMKADSRGNVRETDADMVSAEVVAVRPNLPALGEEYRLRVKILPLRLHVDQDALDFLKRFFSFSEPTQKPVGRKKLSEEAFIQHVEIFPIELKLDYKPKRVDFAALREGKTIELMNFFHFDGAEMTLRHITMSGVSGWARLSTALQDIWTPDVKANQLADVISGVAPIRSMVNVGSGVADLILLPIEQYRKDGRVARGVQRGANSFVRSTALEMMKLGARLATGTQVILEKAEGVLGGRVDRQVVSTVRDGDIEDVSSEDEIDIVSRFANQPSGAKEGVQAAYESLSKNVNAAAQTILAVPMEVYERSGNDGPLRAVVRAVPIAVLKPMIGASEAVSKTLLGVRNSLDPQGKEEQGDKYK